MIPSQRRPQVTAWLVATILITPVILPATVPGTSSRYSAIVDRNPFDLRAPPPPVVSVAERPVPSVPLATVALTGLTSILARNVALLEIILGPGKPVLRPILAEGEKVESVELVRIDMDRNQVVIRNGLVLTNVALRAGSSPNQSPNPPNLGTLLGPGPAVSHGAQGTSDPGVPGRRKVVLAGGHAPAGEDSSVPPRPIRSNGGLSPEASVLMIEAQRQRNPASFPPLPPTVLSPR